MSLSVNVLTPTGHRQNVKVNQNTSVLQILEEVCRKQKLLAADYDLKHYNKILDLSSTVRFSNLSNNAQLELVKAVTSKTETNVQIVLQLTNGQRLMTDFPTTQSLWEILSYWQSEIGENLLELRDEGGNVMEPVCIYIRREVVGEDSLKSTTLRSLGLTSGKAILRLNYRAANRPVQQAYVESMILSQPKVEPPIKLNEKKEEFDSKMLCDESIEYDASCDTGAFKLQSSQEDGQKKQPLDDSWVSSSDHFWGSGQSFTEMPSTSGYITENGKSDMELPVTVQDETKTHLGNISKKRSADNQSDAEEKLVYLDDKGSLLYRLDEARTQPYNDRLADDFFTITLDDVRLLLSDLTRQRKEMEDILLQTQASREAAYLSRLNKYPKTVIRVNFPDRFVLQGSFKSIDTVQKLMDFVKSFLEDESQEFHLYITPPKYVLKPEERLFELALVPAAVVHFASCAIKEHYLRKNIMGKVSSLSAANRSSRSARSSELLRTSKSEPESEEMPSTSNSRVCQETSLSELPSTSHASAERVVPSTGAIPKWFKTGKK